MGFNTNSRFNFDYACRWVAVHVAGNRAIFWNKQVRSEDSTFNQTLAYTDETASLETVGDLEAFVGGKLYFQGELQEASRRLDDVYIEGGFECVTISEKCERLNQTPLEGWTIVPKRNSPITENGRCFSIIVPLEYVRSKDSLKIDPLEKIRSWRAGVDNELWPPFDSYRIVQAKKSDHPSWIEFYVSEDAVDNFLNLGSNVKNKGVQEQPYPLQPFHPETEIDAKLRINVAHRLGILSQAACNHIVDWINQTHASELDKKDSHSAASTAALDLKKRFYRDVPAVHIDWSNDGQQTSLKKLTISCPAHSSADNLTNKLKKEGYASTTVFKPQDCDVPFDISKIDPSIPVIGNATVSDYDITLYAYATPITISNPAQILRFVEQVGGLSPVEAIDFLGITYDAYVTLTLNNLEISLSQSPPLSQAKKDQEKEQVKQKINGLIQNITHLPSINQIILTLTQRTAPFSASPADQSHTQSVSTNSKVDVSPLFCLEDQEVGQSINVPEKDNNGSMSTICITVPNYFAEMVYAAHTKKNSLINANISIVFALDDSQSPIDIKKVPLDWTVEQLYTYLDQLNNRGQLSHSPFQSGEYDLFFNQTVLNPYELRSLREVMGGAEHDPILMLFPSDKNVKLFRQNIPKYTWLLAPELKESEGQSMYQMNSSFETDQEKEALFSDMTQLYTAPYYEIISDYDETGSALSSGKISFCITEKQLNPASAEVRREVFVPNPTTKFSTPDWEATLRINVGYQLGMVSEELCTDVVKKIESNGRDPNTVHNNLVNLDFLNGVHSIFPACQLTQQGLRFFAPSEVCSLAFKAFLKANKYEYQDGMLDHYEIGVKEIIDGEGVAQAKSTLWRHATPIQLTNLFEVKCFLSEVGGFSDKDILDIFKAKDIVLDETFFIQYRKKMVVRYAPALIEASKKTDSSAEVSKIQTKIQKEVDQFVSTFIELLPTNNTQNLLDSWLNQLIGSNPISPGVTSVTNAIDGEMTIISESKPVVDTISIVMNHIPLSLLQKTQGLAPPF